MILLQQQQQPLSAAGTQPLHPPLLQPPLSFLVQCSSGSNHSVPQHINHSSHYRFSHRSNSGSFHCRRTFAHPTIAPTDAILHPPQQQPLQHPAPQYHRLSHHNYSSQLSHYSSNKSIVFVLPSQQQRPQHPDPQRFSSSSPLLHQVPAHCF